MELLDITQNEYFALRGDPPLVSSTMLKCFRQEGPWTYHHVHEANLGEPRVPSASMKIGTLFHDFAAHCGAPKWKVIPNTYSDGEPINLRKKAHREFVGEIQQAAKDEGTIAVGWEQSEKIIKMYDSVLANKQIAEMIQQEAKREVVGTGVIEDVGVKGMADVLLDDRTIIDYKTTSRHTPEDFLQDIYRFRYHWQAAFYMDLFTGLKFYIVAVRNFEPYEAMMYQIPESLIQMAMRSNRQALTEIAWCRAIRSWHSPGWEGPINVEEGIQRRTR